VAVTALNLANACRDLGKTDDAERYYKQALAIKERTYGSTSVNLMAVLKDYEALLRKQQKRTKDADELARRWKELGAKAGKKG
jgi:tetratricopeptide (TPR) repeat protein